VDGSLKDVARRILSGDYLDDGETICSATGSMNFGRISSNHGYGSEHGSGNWLDALWDDLMQRVFHGRGSLRVVQLSNAPGEFGLRVGENHISAS